MRKSETDVQRIDNPQQLDSLFSDDKRYVVLIFYADWCQPSQLIKQTLMEKHRKMLSCVLALVNVDDSDPILSNQFKVDVIPRLFLLQQHAQNILGDFIGADEKQLDNLLSETTRHY